MEDKRELITVEMPVMTSTVNKNQSKFCEFLQKKLTEELGEPCKVVAVTKTFEGE